MRPNDQQHIVVLGAQPEWLSGLRGPMIRDFLARGYHVTAIGAEEMLHVRTTLEGWGADYVVVPIRRTGLNPVADASAMYALYRVLRRLKPDILFAYTIKPVIYGMTIARVAGVPRRFAMVPGRGFALQPGRELSRWVAGRIARTLYRVALRHAHGVFFHNEEDRTLFTESGMVPSHVPTKRIWGSGVDLAHHHPEPLSDGPITFLMVGRLIRDKGVREYVAAAKRVKARHPNVRFRLVGPTDPSPNGVTETEIAQWREGGSIEYEGAARDVRPAIAGCHVLVLPSYGEGLPRSVLEAMAAGRAIITTDAPGCPDTVKVGETGWVVPVRDVDALAAAMERSLDRGFLAHAGQASLAFARERFQVDSVNAEIASFMQLREREQPEA